MAGHDAVIASPEVDAWFTDRDHPLTEAMQAARRLEPAHVLLPRQHRELHPSTKVVSMLFHRRAEIPGEFPPLLGDGLVRTMRFTEELQAVIRAWCAARR